jgi:hypothetical protein
MTTTDWMPTLEDEVGRARHFLRENTAPDVTATDQAGQALRHASDALMAILGEFGVGTPVGWRLHQLRSRLDAHLLAASALADADAPEAVVSVLRRSLDLIGPELEALRLGGTGSRQDFSPVPFDSPGS